MAQQLVDRGTIKEEEAEETRWSDVMWNSLGGHSSDVKPDVYKATLELGDTVLLCTDGLTREVSDPRIVEILSAGSSAERMARDLDLVAAANDSGGSDNITVVVARFEGANKRGS